MELYGYSARMIADLTGVSLKTAQRWKHTTHDH
jgi:transposase